MSLIRRSFLRRLSRRERGQAIILSLFAMTVVFFVGAIAVDVGLWLSEKRGAQTDADLPALAGAWELLPNNGGQALNAVNDWAADNDETSNLTVDNVTVDDSCFNQGTNDAVTVDVKHESRTLFSSLFGVATAPDIEAHAKACAGAATGLGGVTPFEMSDDTAPCFVNEQPVLTSFCPVEGGSHSPNPRGILDLEAPADYCSASPGSGKPELLIETGAPGNCFINTRGGACGSGPWYDCVAVQTGNAQKILDGTTARIRHEGVCDAQYGNGDGIDQFGEVVDLISGSGVTGTYEAKDCDPNTPGKQTSSRLVTIIILDTVPGPGNGTYPIKAFAAMYLVGCADEAVVVTVQTDTDRNCEDPGVYQPGPTGDLYVAAPGLGPLPAPNACHRGTPHGQQITCNTPTPAPPASPTPAAGPSCTNPGQCVVWAQILKLIVTNQGGVGAPTDQTTVFGISLVE